MSAAALSRYIGKMGQLRVDRDFVCSVEIVDARLNFGAIQFLVRPLSGEGRKWVDSDRVTVE